MKPERKVVETLRRKDREESPEFALELLKTCEYAVLSTVNADGSPYGIPVSPVFMDGCFYFHCAPEGKKLENIRRDSRVGLVCIGRTRLLPEKFTTEYESAALEGRAVIVTDQEEKRRALLCLCEKYARENMAAAKKAIEGSLHRTGICRIEPVAVTGKAKRNIKTQNEAAQ